MFIRPFVCTSFDLWSGVTDKIVNWLFINIRTEILLIFMDFVAKFRGKGNCRPEICHKVTEGY